MQLSEFELESTSIWSFPARGNWATHSPKYRGNFAPQIPRNLILRYSKENDVVLDPLVGSGTTLIECKLTARRGIGIDINPDAIKLTQQNVDFKGPGKVEAYVGDARSLGNVDSNSIDLIVTHPPYLDIIKYSNGQIQGDLSNIHDVNKFCGEIEKVGQELYRVLKNNHFCAILMGDTRRKGHFVPLAFSVLQRFLKLGFVLKEDVIKIQHNCTTTPYWKNQSKRFNFLLIMHEHLFIFRKP